MFTLITDESAEISARAFLFVCKQNSAVQVYFPGYSHGLFPYGIAI